MTVRFGNSRPLRGARFAHTLVVNRRGRQAFAILVSGCLRLRFGCRRLLLRVLFRQVMADDTAADGADDCMMAGVVSSYSTDDSAFQAPSGGGRACASEQRDT